MPRAKIWVSMGDLNYNKSVSLEGLDNREHTIMKSIWTRVRGNGFRVRALPGGA